MDRSIIEQYARGGEKLRDAIKGLSPVDLQAFPVPGTWSIQQIVIHLMDADLIGADRMKRIIAEENPLITAYNESAFAQKLRYHEQSVEDALALVELVRRQFSRVLRQLAEPIFERTGIHTEVGKITLSDEVAKYNQHLDHHLKFIKEKRALLGK